MFKSIYKLLADKNKKSVMIIEDVNYWYRPSIIFSPHLLPESV